MLSKKHIICQLVILKMSQTLFHLLCPKPKAKSWGFFPLMLTITYFHFKEAQKIKLFWTQPLDMKGNEIVICDNKVNVIMRKGAGSDATSCRLTHLV